MEVALPIIRAILVAVFATAGVAKLADLEGSRGAVAGFGVPERLARPLGTLLPFTELTVAALLVFGGTARAGALGALALLAAFSAGIAGAMARGEAPDCHCFGQLHSEPAGPRTLARSLSLAGLAAIAAFAGSGPGAGLDDVGSLSGSGAAGDPRRPDNAAGFEVGPLLLAELGRRGVGVDPFAHDPVPVALRA